MKAIKGLIIKDLQNIKSYKLTILIFIVIFSMTSFVDASTSTYLPVFMTVCFGMLAISSFSYDNLANSDRYLLTLPITRKDIVKARYFYALFMNFLGGVIGYVITFIFTYLKTGSIGDMSEYLITTLGAIRRHDDIAPIPNTNYVQIWCRKRQINSIHYGYFNHGNFIEFSKCFETNGSFFAWKYRKCN